MSSNVESIATPLVRGVLAALSALGIALAVVVVPALAAQVAGTTSTATVLDAIIIALSILVLGHGGGVMLSTGVIDGAVTLTPFGLLLLLVALSALSMRRVGRALRPVRADGVLRAGALRDAGSALGMYALVYAIGLGILAGIGRSADASPMVLSAAVSGAMVAVIGGLIGMLWSLRREPTDEVPGVRVLDLLPAPYGDVARAALLAMTGLLGAGLAVTVAMMALSVPAQASLFDGLAPGFVGGIVLFLLQLALLPLLVVWAMTVVLGGTVGVGASSGISLDGSAPGVLPALPILGAVPGPGDFPAVMWLLLLLPAVPIGLGTVRLVRDVADLERREQIIAWVAYPLTVIVACLLVAGLSTGGIGDSRLVHLGPQMSTLLLPLISVVVVSTAVVLAVLATPLVPWVRSTAGSLRERVETAESTERSGTAAPAAAPGAGTEPDVVPGAATEVTADAEPDPVADAEPDSAADAESGTTAGAEPGVEDAAADASAPAALPAAGEEPEEDVWASHDDVVQDAVVQDDVAQDAAVSRDEAPDADAPDAEQAGEVQADGVQPTDEDPGPERP